MADISPIAHYIHEDARLGVYVDGPHLHSVSRSLGINIDFKALGSDLRRDCHCMRLAYYTTSIPASDDGHVGMRPLLDFLDYNGWQVICRELHTRDRETGRIKGYLVDMAVDIMAQSEHQDHILIVSGDRDLLRLVETLTRKGKTVTLMSSIESASSYINDALRRTADQFIEIKDIISEYTLRRRVEEDTPDDVAA